MQIACDLLTLCAVQLVQVEPPLPLLVVPLLAVPLLPRPRRRRRRRSPRRTRTWASPCSTKQLELQASAAA